MYTDQEKNRIAWKEYSKFNVGKEVDIESDGKKEKRIGYVSEIFGHLVWFWSIEIIRRDLRNRITHEPDPEIPLGSNR